MKACEMLPLNEYEHSKSRTSLAFDSCEQQQHNHHQQLSDHINGRVNVTSSRRMTPYSEGTLRSSEQIYFPSPYALSRVVSVYDSNDVVVPQQQHLAHHHNPVTLSKTTSSSSPSSSPRHHLSTTPSHSSSGNRQHHQKQHYDVPFKQASLSLFVLCSLWTVSFLCLLVKKTRQLVRKKLDRLCNVSISL
jgi:hypothetical protein